MNNFTKKLAHKTIAQTIDNIIHKKHWILDHVFVKRKYPYNYSENKHKTHLSVNEINIIHVILATFLGIKWIQHDVFLHKQFAYIRVLFLSLTVVVLFNRLHRVYAVWFQI